MSSNENEIIEKNLEDLLFAGFRVEGEYIEIEDAMARVARVAGMWKKGNPVGLNFQKSHSDEDADVEGGYEVGRDTSGDGVESKTLKGGKAVTLLHRGSYESLGESYKKLFDYIENKGYKPHLPIREIRHKGPGKLLRGSSSKFETELQVVVE